MIDDRVLTGPSGVALVEQVVSSAGGRLRSWSLRSIHHRGDATTSAVGEAAITDVDGRDRTLLYVLHVSRRAVPPGAAVLDLDGRGVHVWRFPDDPYLPGLRPAVDTRRGAELLAAHTDRPVDARPTAAIHTRSYRPGRRAVVEVREHGSPEPALYLKVLGGRTPDHVHDRAASLAAVHRHLVDHLPVPPVLTATPDTGTVVLQRLRGTTLRTLLREGRDLPGVGEVVGIVQQVAAAPTPPGDAEPDRYADVSRHVTLLGRALPDATQVLAAVASAVETVGGPRTTVHGDLHDGQLLVDDGRVTGLLDVDGAGTGLLANDLGRLVAHVEAASLTVPAHAQQVTAYAEALADQLAGLVTPHDLALGAAAAWIGLATGPQRVRAPGWQDRSRQRIDRARAWAERA